MRRHAHPLPKVSWCHRPKSNVLSRPVRLLWLLSVPPRELLCNATSATSQATSPARPTYPSNIAMGWIFCWVLLFFGCYSLVFPRENTSFLTFWTDLVWFSLVFLRKNIVLSLIFPRENTVFLTFWTDLVWFLLVFRGKTYINLRKTYVILGFCRDNVFLPSCTDCVWLSLVFPRQTYNTSSEKYVTLRFSRE